MDEKITKSKLRLGKRIQKLRKDNTPYSQEDFAHKVNISRTHMGHIEQGRKSPSMKLLEKIARVLNVKPKDLFS